MTRAARGRKAAARTPVALRLRAIASLLACAAAAATFAAPAGAAGSMYELQVDGVQTADWSIYSGGGPELTGNTSSTVYNNVSRAYATGSDGSLWEYLASNSRGVGPRAANLSALTGAPAMQPGTAVTVFNSMLRVYSVSTSGVLYETVNNGANGREWNSYPINGAGAPALTGNLQATTVGGKLRVISVAASTGLPWELVVDNLNGREWNAYQAGTVAVRGDIALTVYNGMPRVYGTDGYGTVWEMDRNGASGNIWNTYSLAGLAGTPSAKPGVAVTQYASMIRVFTIGRDGHLWETFNNGANGHEWNSYDNSGQAGLPAVRGHIRAFVAGGYMRTYVLGETGILYEALTNGGPWRSFALSSYVQGPEPETNISVINDPAGQPRIYGLSTNTPTSWRYGGDDESVNTPDEADAVISLLRSQSNADATNTTNALSPADRTYVQQRAQATMPSSAAYGGANLKVDNAAEADAFIGGLRAASSDDAAAVMVSGLASGDSSLVDSRIAGAGFAFGGLYFDVVNRQLWEYENATKSLVTSDEAIQQFGLDRSAAIRVTPGAMAVIQTAAPIEALEIDPEDDGDDASDFQEATPLSENKTLWSNTSYHCVNSGSTIRNAGFKYAIGTCLEDESFTVKGATKWPSPNGNMFPVYYGAFGGRNFTGCGWLETATYNTIDDYGRHLGTTGCSYRGIYESVFAKRIYGKGQQAKTTTMDCHRWRNVTWSSSSPQGEGVDYFDRATTGSLKNPVTGEGGSDKDAQGRPWLKAGTPVTVRWKTKGGGFYMVRYPQAGLYRKADNTAVERQPQKWAFISKNCLDIPDSAGRAPYADSPGAKKGDAG